MLIRTDLPAFRGGTGPFHVGARWYARAATSGIPARPICMYVALPCMRSYIVPAFRRIGMHLHAHRRQIDGCVPLFEQRLAALVLANARLSFFSFFLNNDDERAINQIEKVACSFVRARFGRRSTGTLRSDRCDGQMKDAATETNLAMVKLKKQWKEKSWFARRRWV